MRAVILANGKSSNLSLDRRLLRDDDWIIAADGGALLAKALDLIPHVIIGDLDSLSEATLANYESKGTSILPFPTRKDETDLELAFQHAKANAVEEILVLGGLGARWDQTLANILLTIHPEYRHLAITFADGNQTLQLIGEGEKLELSDLVGDTLSLLPIGGDAYGITTTGLVYPLQEGDLRAGSTRGVSNVIQNDTASVQLAQGLLLCILIHQSECTS